MKTDPMGFMSRCARSTRSTSREFGSGGEGDGQFTWPTSIALDGDGNVYVADEWLNRISIFDKDGTFLSKWGKPGSGDGELNKPAGLAISQRDHVGVR